MYSEHQDWIRTISISSKDKYLVSGCVSGHIYCWDPETGKVVTHILNAEPFSGGDDNYLSTINCLCFAKTNE